MSIAVALTELPTTLGGFPWGYLITVDNAGGSHMVAVPTVLESGALVLDAGRGTRDNATVRPHVTMLFPPREATEMSLIVDGTATVSADAIRVVPTHAVLHRPAVR